MFLTLTDLVSGADRLRVRTALRQIQIQAILDRLAAADPGAAHHQDIQTLRDFLK